MNKLTIRFYEELNDFLPVNKRKQPFQVPFKGHPAVKDVIESRGVPHTEVDLILVNGESRDFHYQVQDGDYISVYPVFESLDISRISRLRQKPLRTSRFILDVHLGKLARYLRLCGFDTVYRNDYDDPEIASIANRDKRIVLTRDLGLLKRSLVERGYWVRSQVPQEQLQEVILRFDLKSSIAPFKFCLRCNGSLKEVAKQSIIDQLLPGTREHYQVFYRCQGCRQIFWKGTHYPNLMKIVAQFSR